MTRYVVWQEVIAGWVEGETRNKAYTEAVKQFGDCVTRVEPVVNYGPDKKETPEEDGA